MADPKEMREIILDIIGNQMRDNDPKETNLTHLRLTDEGYSSYDAKMLIGQCVAVELFNIMKYQEVFDKQRYIKNLNALPKELLIKPQVNPL